MEIVGRRVRIMERTGRDEERSMPVQDARALWRELGAALSEADLEISRRRSAGKATADDLAAWGEESQGQGELPEKLPLTSIGLMLTGSTSTCAREPSPWGTVPVQAADKHERCVTTSSGELYYEGNSAIIPGAHWWCLASDLGVLAGPRVEVPDVE
jgi:hypothetical protein